MPDATKDPARSALEVVDLSATFVEDRRRLQVLRDVSFSVQTNEFTCNRDLREAARRPAGRPGLLSPAR
ncbi:MAG: hypothetical protein R2848_05110 [Thermomicrobiales bacterium]